MAQARTKQIEQPRDRRWGEVTRDAAIAAEKAGYRVITTTHDGEHLAMRVQLAGKPLPKKLELLLDRGGFVEHDAYPGELVYSDAFRKKGDAIEEEDEDLAAEEEAAAEAARAAVRARRSKVAKSATR